MSACPSVASYRAGCRCAPCRSHVRALIILGEQRRAERRPGRGVTGCAVCGAGDVRPGPCQSWCGRVKAAS